MAHGIFHGVKHSVVHGLKHGSLTFTTTIPGVTQDSGSGIYAPATSGEWTTFLAAAGIASGNPGFLWNCQEASGNLADAIGSTPLVVAGAPTYQNSVAGWNRKSVNITATTVQAFSAAVATGPIASATSVAYYGYVRTPNTPGGNRILLSGSDNVTLWNLMHNAANKIVLSNGPNTATSVSSYTSPTVWPLLMVHNLTNSTSTCWTSLEKFTVAFNVVVDGNKGFGALGGNGDAGSGYLYLTAFTGAASEFDDTNARKLFTTAGWSVPW